MTSSDPIGPAQVREALTVLRRACTELEPNVIPLPDVPAVFDDLCTMQKLVSGAVTRLTPRYSDSITGKPGVKDPSEDVARKTGTSKGAVRRQRRVADKAASQPGLDDALRTGKLSNDQADLIGGSDLPEDDVDELIAKASRTTTTDLRDEVARLRAKREDEQTRARRIHADRKLRRWTAPDGSFHLHLNGPAAWGAEIQARLQPLVDHAWAQARRDGTEEPREAYEADALVQLVTGGPADASEGQAVRPERKVIATVDLDALNRGRCEGDETCEIAGVGPVPVAQVRAMLATAVLAVVVRDAVDVRSVVHLGRQVTAHQRTALEARGYACRGCGSTHRLEIDHVTGWSLTRTTTLTDLEWLCPRCHDRKTHRGWRWIGEPGRRTLVPPGGTAPPRGSGPSPPGPAAAAERGDDRTDAQTALFVSAC